MATMGIFPNCISNEKPLKNLEKEVDRSDLQF
jgi:hypothetical protein